MSGFGLAWAVPLCMNVFCSFIPTTTLNRVASAAVAIETAKLRNRKAALEIRTILGALLKAFFLWALSGA